MALTTDTTGNPIKVTGTASSDETITDVLAFVKWIYWYKPTTAGHLINITDKHGNTIVPGYCETDNESQWLPIYSTCDGIHCDNMDSGALYIYIK